jgi:uncharacterized damage-inducible protein DinB
MSEVSRLVDQLERVVESGPWHGDAVVTILDDVTFAQADRAPQDGAHSIREIVRHMTSWTKEVHRRMNGELAGEPEGGDWPAAAGATEDAWRAERAALETAHRALIADLRAMDDEQLQTPIRDARFKDEKGVTRYILLHGLVQHHAYHSGQIALLKRLT